MLFVDVFREGFLKKWIWSRPTFTGEILYLFCTCIINWDVFNYFGCWNKACEVVYSVAEFALSCFATVVKQQSGVGEESVPEFPCRNSFDAEPRLRTQLFCSSCAKPNFVPAAEKTKTVKSLTVVPSGPADILVQTSQTVALNFWNRYLKFRLLISML